MVEQKFGVAREEEATGEKRPLEGRKESESGSAENGSGRMKSEGTRAMAGVVDEERYEGSEEEEG